MPDHHRTEQSLVAEHTFADLPDADVVEYIRSGAPAARPAAQEFRRRHLPAVLAYACLFGKDHIAADDLAARAFVLATQEAVRGIDPQGTWRHRLLVLVQQAALAWAAGGGRGRLAPDFVDWLTSTGGTTSDRSVPLGLRPRDGSMLTAFHRLPERARGVLWHSVMEQEPDNAVSLLLGIEPDALEGIREPAQEAMRQAYLRAHLERNGDRTCQGYQRIIEAAAQPGDHRYSADLERHLAGCRCCATALTELIRMRQDPRTILADGLLGWGGADYLAAGPVQGVTGAEEGPDQEATALLPVHPPATAALSGLRHQDRRPTRRVSLPVVAVAVAVALIALLAAESTGPSPAGSGTTPSRPVPVTATATVTSTATASVTLPPSQPPGTAPTGSAQAMPHHMTTPWATLPPGHYSQVVDVASGLCLDIRDGVLENHTDVVANPCDASGTQFWRLDSRGLLHTAADPGFCLDSRGDTDRGVGIWSCSSFSGYHGLNLVFALYSTGVIGPRIAPGFAVTPVSGSPGTPLVLRRFTGVSCQRWRSGRLI